MKFSKEKTYIVQSQAVVVDGLVRANLLEGELCKNGGYTRRLGSITTWREKANRKAWWQLEEG